MKFGLTEFACNCGCYVLMLALLLGVTGILIAAGILHTGSGQTYWYCWNEGAAAPHHVGHVVDGDHYCSDEELRNAGIES